MDQQHNGAVIAGRPVADAVAVQDDLVLAGQQISQTAPVALVNCAFVASRGGDIGLLGNWRSSW
jgi:hypothetical protein